MEDKYNRRENEVEQRDSGLESKSDEFISPEEERANKKPSKAATAITTIILISLFAGAIIGGFMRNVQLTVSCFGLLIAFLGAALVKQSQMQGIVFVFAGLAIVAGAFIFTSGDTELQRYILVNLLPKAVAILVLLFGIGLGIGYIIHYNIKCSRCTDEVTGTCIGNEAKNVTVRRRNSSGTTTISHRLVYIPTFEFKYNNKTRRFKAQSGDTSVEYAQGDTCSLYINPDNEEEVWKKTGKGYIVSRVIMSAMLVFFGCTLLFVTFTLIR